MSHPRRLYGNPERRTFPAKFPTGAILLRIVAVANQKGGVGKTTLAFNLAKGLAARGNRVLAVDNDPQGNLTSAFLENPETLRADVLTYYEGPKPVQPQEVGDRVELLGANIHLSRVAEGTFETIYRLKEGLEQIDLHYDFVIIDCLPSLGYLNLAALYAATNVLVPVKPTPFALGGLRDLFDTLEKTRKRLNPDLRLLGLVLNLIEGTRTTVQEELESVIRETYGDRVFRTTISKGVAFEESPALYKSIFEHAPRGKHAGQFNALLDEFVQRVEAE
jgi:chromosome partitioning protein